MLKTIAASQGAKLFAACVCPVAASVAVTMAVPPVRRAVYKATAPRAYALPKARARVPETPIPIAAASPPCALDLTSSPLADPAFVTPYSGPSIDPVGPTPITPPSPIPIPPYPYPPVPPVPPTPPVPVVPEPAAWVQMLIGFGLIGVAVRYALRRSKLDEPGSA